MRKLLALLLVLAGPVHATQDAWPALYNVAGVAADDMLNIRERPDAGSDIIGTLAPDATDIEVIAPDDAERWGRVNTGEGTGWVSLSYLRRHPGQWLGAYPAIASCSGTEPFWNLSLEDETARYSTPEGSEAGRVTARLASSARRDRHGLIVEFEDRTLHGVVAARQCNDGMSDGLWGLSFDAIGGGDVLSGCCTLAK